jgi:hypothetical protein
MKKNILLLLILLCSITFTQAQKNKKQANPAAAATEDKGWKPTKGDTRNPFDTTKTKQAGKGKTMAVKKKPINGMEAEDTDEYKAGSNSKKMKKAGKQNAAADNLIEGDDPFGKQANGLGEGEDPFDKAPRGKNRKKAAGQEGYISDSLKTKKGKQAKAAGYANQDVSYMQQPAPSPQPSAATQPAPTNEATGGNNSNITAVGQQAAPNNTSQASTVDKSPGYIHVRFDMENIEAIKKELTRGLNESENEVGWYKKLRVQSAGIDNLRIFSVTLYKVDGSFTVIPINEIIVKGGTPTSLFNTGLKNETKNNITILEKINKVSVFYELLDPTAKKKNMCAIQVYLFK